MRGHHLESIAAVNAMCKPYYVRTGRKRYRVTSPVLYELPCGHGFVLPVGMEGDLFTCVPDTGYLEFHKSAWLHDALRLRKDVYSREFSDFAFAYDMHRRIAVIRSQLLLAKCPVKVVDREAVRLTRLASMYALGVSGLIGSAYIALDKWF
jgi:hypothetical protein